MLNKLVRIAFIFIAVLIASQSVAAEGPATGTASFRPKLGFNPTCGIKGVPEPVKQLGVNPYDKKIYGYVRYCAVKRGQGVEIKLIHEWTNGRKVGTGPLCSSHAWYAADGSTVYSVNRTLDHISPKGDVIVSTSALLTMEQFKSVREWAWDFYYCANRTSALPSTTLASAANFVVVLRVFCADAQGGTGNVDSTATSPDSCEAAESAAMSVINSVPDFCKSQLSGSYLETGELDKISTNTCP